MKHFSLWIVSIVSLMGCAGMSSKDDAMVKEEVARDVNDEIRVGREVAAKLLGHLGATSNPPVEEYVNLVGQTLVKKVGRPELQYRFAILKTAEFNAYACPGGYIFVTKGLLAQLTNESELAGVLGHEIAHVNEKHMYNEIAPKRQVSAGETLARMMSRGNSDLGHSIAQMVNKGLKLLLEEGLGKEKELAADEAGAVYAAAAGYNPTSLRDLLHRLQNNPNGARLGKAAIPFTERVANLDRAMTANGLENTMAADSIVLQHRFAQTFSGTGKFE